MGAPPDPESMASMLSDPHFASTLNEALSNPQVVDMLINQSPLLRDMGPVARQMLRSEEFRRMMTDPNSLRQMTEMSRAMGINPYGGAGPGGAGGSFPAPGITDTTPPTAGGTGGTGANNQTATQTNTTGTPLNNPLLGNPFLSAFGLGGLPPPRTGQNQPPPNPFAALFDSALNPPTTQPSGSDQQGQQEQPQQPQQQQQQQRSIPPLGTDPAILQNPQLMNLLASLLGPVPGGNSNEDNPSQGQNTDSAPPPFHPLLPYGLFAPGGAAGTTPPPGIGAGGGSSTVTDTRPPEERYEAQLRQLNDMGFYDFDRNVEALRRTGGNVNGAVEYLLTH